jgi:hypothetical protein
MNELVGDLLAPPHVPTGSLLPIDLTQKTNRTLEDSGMSFTSLADLPLGYRTFGGVEFMVVNGFVQLGSEMLREVSDRVEGILVGSKLKTLYFLHGTRWGTGERSVVDGTVIGHYVAHYDDNTMANIPIVYGEDLRDIWDADNMKPVDRGRLAWIGRSPSSRFYLPSLLRLYVGSWDNPYPEKQVTSIDYSSTSTKAAPFCIAMTLERAASPRLEKQP